MIRFKNVPKTWIYTSPKKIYRWQISIWKYVLHHTSCCCSVTKCDSLQPHGLQHTRLPCPSLSLGVCSNSCPLSRWWNLTTSSSVTPFSTCSQSFTASSTFPVSWLFASGGQSAGASASPSVLSMNTQGWFPLGLSGLISLLSKVPVS